MEQPNENVHIVQMFRYSITTHYCQTYPMDPITG